MPYFQDFTSYHASIAKELSITKDRIRNLIGPAHWQSDGEHKEAILRRVLRTHLPVSTLVGKGFVCTQGWSSPQIDLLLIDANKPTLFKEGETFLVTPDAVKGVIEVKTTLRRAHLGGNQAVFMRLADTVERIRETGNHHCQAGVFAYSNDRMPINDVLTSLAEAAQGSPSRVVNWVVLSENRFIRYWDDAPHAHPGAEREVWHSYNLPDLAYSYFLGNVVFDVGRQVPFNMQDAWFPLEGGKEARREHFVRLRDPYRPTAFHRLR